MLQTPDADRVPIKTGEYVPYWSPLAFFEAAWKVPINIEMIAGQMFFIDVMYSSFEFPVFSKCKVRRCKKRIEVAISCNFRSLCPQPCQWGPLLPEGWLFLNACWFSWSNFDSQATKESNWLPNVAWGHSCQRLQPDQREVDEGLSTQKASDLLSEDSERASGVGGGCSSNLLHVMPKLNSSKMLWRSLKV